jgi:hypothetical protein
LRASRKLSTSPAFLTISETPRYWNVQQFRPQ